MKEDEGCDANGSRIEWLVTHLFDVARTFLDFFTPLFFLSRCVSLCLAEYCAVVRLFKYGGRCVTLSRMARRIVVRSPTSCWSWVDRVVGRDALVVREPRLLTKE